MKISIILMVLMLGLMGTSIADEVMPGFLIKKTDGSMKACFVVSKMEAICWSMYEPAILCVPMSETVPTLICNATEV